tara:strand:- start:40436 stop:40732 length:297 start_codon:yes stop_codon:yes gene_type:complete
MRTETEFKLACTAVVVALVTGIFIGMPLGARDSSGPRWIPSAQVPGDGTHVPIRETFGETYRYQEWRPHGEPGKWVDVPYDERGAYYIEHHQPRGDWE